LSPFIITTFVRFFETLVTNVNATLLKLPSFAKCIFLIDEIQSLPPRLYTFFVAYISAFCEKFDSYCIVSTATMPCFTIKNENAQKLFKDYIEPEELLSFEYFNHNLFNRYQIQQRAEDIELEQLAEMVLAESQSLLVILNTIDDTKNLYIILAEYLEKDELVLLNTHFTPNDRKYKIDYAKLRLEYKKKIVLISTQLIEAGVDIDFPTVYRDMATIPSIIQSAGRCNRNGKLKSLGKVVVFNLSKNGKLRAELIYRGRESKLLRDTKERVFTQGIYEENQLFDTQKAFFEILSEELVFSEHVQKKPEIKINFVNNINTLAFETIGKFRLIDEDYFGEEFRCYVPVDKDDKAFEELIQLNEILKIAILVPKPDKDFKKIMSAKFAVEEHLKKMSNQIIQVRLKDINSRPLTLKSYSDLHLVNTESYNNEIGILLGVENQII
jgi:CRISPR-associated endonuclease/helicase Cas3